MPAVMNLYRVMEIIALPETTYIRIDDSHDSHRRIYTDGRDWPTAVQPALLGYSIGRWIDQEGDGRGKGLQLAQPIDGPAAADLPADGFDTFQRAKARPKAEHRSDGQRQSRRPPRV
jgi:hypothetical protein